MDKITFTISPEHLKLLKHVCIDWDNCEFGAPCINPKRPYGNSDVYNDMLDILGWRGKCTYKIKGISYAMEFNGELPEEVTKILDKLHKELETVLQICLVTQSFKVGKYETEKYDYDKWKKIK